ncbi:hypothetical protein [Alkalihalobacterium elongatum]|uniref:hypothetical protein n=1 Tax=Alkalihalobacterium elongatum TaxID=2675466 RepID=UPI001C1F75AF|nr:hypothetical protein [Alkalihalobacterium elongatum]
MAVKTKLDEKALLDILQYVHDKASNDSSIDTKKLVDDISERLRPFVNEVAK